MKRPVRTIGVEESYRRYYNVVRAAESKAYATPIFHGELVAFRRVALEKVEGFPVDVGADDSHTATKIALAGFRAIIPENVWVEEILPSKGYFWWRVRRAQHLLQHFAKAFKLRGLASKEFRRILAIEWFLHVVNPFLLPGIHQPANGKRVDRSFTSRPGHLSIGNCVTRCKAI